MRSVNIKAPSHILKKIEAHAKELKCHRSALIRSLIVWGLGQLEAPAGVPKPEIQEDDDLMDFEF